MNVRESNEINVNQNQPCDCLATQNGPWGCNAWKSMILPMTDSSCTFVRLNPKSKCLTHTQQWQHVSTLFTDSCKNENNLVVSDLLMIEAVLVGNGEAAGNMEKYRQKLKYQGVSDVSSKYLFHVTNMDNTVNICKKGLRVPTEYKPGDRIIGNGYYLGQPKYVANLAYLGLASGQRFYNEILTLNNPLTMIMCEVIPGKSYPAYKNPDGSLFTKEKNMDGWPLINGYNSHMSVGLPPHETCFFDTDASKPIYLIKVIRYKLEIQKSLNYSHLTSFNLFKKDYESFLEKHRHENSTVQQEYDKRFGLHLLNFYNGPA